MDREKESTYVTWYHLQKTKEEIEKDYRKEDKLIVNRLETLDGRLDVAVQKISSMETDIKHVSYNTARLVELQEEKNKEERLTHQKIFEKLENHADRITKNEAVTQTMSNESEKKYNLMIKFIVTGGSIVGAVLGFLKVIAPYFL